MSDRIEETILRATRADSLKKQEVLQRLWSGYGSIIRYALEGGDYSSVIVKHVSPPSSGQHPRGWNTDLSHQRKLESYRVESAWYQNFSRRCRERCRVPDCLALETNDDEVVMILEDLDAAGFSKRLTDIGESEIQCCLEWLADFHATFLGEKPDGLWMSGTYWHLETRPDELNALAVEDADLYEMASLIDLKLKASPYQTLVHGDAKLANFCFTEGHDSVAAVDFQYVGAGCGMKDVAYFLGSCLSEDTCEEYERPLLDFYFTSLRDALLRKKVQVDLDLIEADWRDLYPVAWTDFHRFLKGWSPGHWKIHSYSERLAREVVADLRKSEM